MSESSHGQKVTGVATQGRELLARADSLMRQLERLAAASGDEAARARFARAAGRLAGSVVRPLGDALGAPAPGEQAPAEESRLWDELHELACDATRLRARAGGPAELLEATAALQDLTCQVVAGDPAGLASRRSELAGLQASLDPAIQSAADGPYLVTNAPALVDRLGVSLEPLPQVALCRCGASGIKPWCDGSHAQIGFRAAKDPERVPDRLDAYQGSAGHDPRQPRHVCAFGFVH